ncbi:MAG: thioredoxin domain-containing protein [Ignavibacteriae bacterium]|nr:thioredoxin domain-containing protein [Ignavibacteriota bacterium]
MSSFVNAQEVLKSQEKSKEILNPRKPNRLINEKSPYLLQHAYNPVDWYPWGEEAFQKARRENKPIFLSVGYSTCYWCHVMEREVFENDSIAKLMNQYVVSIKVDREERPDVDRVYMTALQGMTGGGGWPMSMFLTPDLKPFYGGTYIPPESRWGRPGFKDVVQQIHDAWINDRQRIFDVSQRVETFLRENSKRQAGSTQVGPQILDKGFESFVRSYDTRYGGFGGAPKFPRPVSLNFLLRYYSRAGNKKALEMSLETLRRMAHGGMYDHVGGGFHRYATDEHWHVPHFEKMLYDQAQLVMSYLEAYQITHEQFFADVAKDVLTYVRRKMTHTQGGFYSAEDAESATSHSKPKEKEEGAFYTWTKKEIDRILTSDEAAVFNFYYDVRDGGNVAEDPHQEFVGENILYAARTHEEVAKKFKLTVNEVRKRISTARQKLFNVREKRPKPHLDDKILVSWNGLMISAFARAYQVLGNTEYLTTAERASQFILGKMYNSKKKQLLRRYREGDVRYEAHLEDFAFFVQGLIDLYESSFNIRWFTAAIELTELQNILFFDNKDGGYYDISGNDKSILVRTKESYDGAEPTGNAIAILNLLRLSAMIDKKELKTMAERSLKYFGESMLNASHAMPQFLVALDFSQSKPKQIIVAGSANDVRTRAMLNEVHARFIPNKIILLADGAEGQKAVARYMPFISSFKTLNGRPTAYICEDYVCQLPTSDVKIVAQLLEGKQ